MGCSYLRIAVVVVSVPISYRGEYHYRSGSTKQVLRGAALDRFLLRKTGRRWDGVPVPSATIDDLDVETLAWFRSRLCAPSVCMWDALDEDDRGLMEKLRLTEGRYLKRAAPFAISSRPRAFRHRCRRQDRLLCERE